MRGIPFLSVAVCLPMVLTACATPASGPYADLAYQRVTPGSTLTLHTPLRIPANQAHADIQAVGSGEMDPYCELEISTVSESPQTVEPDVFEIWRVGRSVSPSSDWGMGSAVQLASAAGPPQKDDRGRPTGLVRAGTEACDRKARRPSGDGGWEEPVQLAAVGIGIGIGGGSGVGVSSDLGIGIGIGGGYGGWWAGRTPPTQLFYKTRFWLRSAKQPDVLQMTCQWDQMTASGAAFARHLTVEEIRAALGSTFTLTLAGQARPVPPAAPR